MPRLPWLLTFGRYRVLTTLAGRGARVGAASQTSKLSRMRSFSTGDSSSKPVAPGASPCAGTRVIKKGRSNIVRQRRLCFRRIVNPLALQWQKSSVLSGMQRHTLT